VSPKSLTQPSSATAKLIAAHAKSSKKNPYLKPPAQDTSRSQAASTLKRASATRKNPSNARTHSVKAKRPHHVQTPTLLAPQVDLPHFNAFKSVWQHQLHRLPVNLAAHLAAQLLLSVSSTVPAALSEHLFCISNDNHNIYFHNTLRILNNLLSFIFLSIW